MRRTLLLSFAHPDDESFFAAGTARKHAEAGDHVVLCCATRGERGATGALPGVTIDNLPVVREQELRNAARALRVGELVFLPYEDQKLSAAPAAEVRSALVTLIRRTRPLVVVTFDPTGANQHPDHIAIAASTTGAVSAAADSRALPQVGTAHAVSRLVWVGPVMPWIETDPGRLVAHAGVDFLVDIRSCREAKAQALAAHRTQHHGIDRLFLHRPNRDAVLSYETFRFGAGVPPPVVPAFDLFAGIEPCGGHT